MYHEVTYDEQRKRRNRWVARFIGLVVIAALAVALALGAQAQAREQGVVSTRDAVINAAKQCCAVEGSYPSSIAHLESHYGLVINHDDYIVSYEWFADNVLPSVVVTAR